MNDRISSRGKGFRAFLEWLPGNIIERVSSLLREIQSRDGGSRMVAFLKNVDGYTLVDQDGKAISLDIWRGHDHDYVMLLCSSVSARLSVDMRSATIHWVGGFTAEEGLEFALRTDIFYIRLPFARLACSSAPLWSWSEAPKLSASHIDMLERAASFA